MSGKTTGGRQARHFVCQDLVALAVVLASAKASAQPTFTVNSYADAPASPGAYDGVCETAPGNGTCTLRAAVMEANRGFGGTIVLPAGVYTLTIPPTPNGGAENGDLDLERTIAIEGAAPSATTVDGNQLDRVFDVSASATVRIEHLTIRNGRAPDAEGYGGDVANGPFSTLVLENVVVSDGYARFGGGGIYSAGTISLRHVIVEYDESGGAGGGIYVCCAGARIEDSLIQYDRAREGGGIANGGPLALERTLVRSNFAEDAISTPLGGGLYDRSWRADGEGASIENCTFEGNESQGRGGAIYVDGAPGYGSVRIASSTITGNLAQSDFSDPFPADDGGGVGAGADAAVFVQNSIVWGNGTGILGTVAVSDDCNNATPILSGGHLFVGMFGSSIACNLTGDTGSVQTDDPLLLGLRDLGGFAPVDSLANDLVTGFSPAVNAVPPEQCTDLAGAPLATDQRGAARSGSCDVGAHESRAGRRPEALLDAELVRNGGASGDELGKASASHSAYTPPYWSPDEGTIGQVLYGSAGVAAQDAPADSGAYYFTGGFSESSSASQVLDVSPLAASIDAGTVHYALSGAFGGLLSDPDYAGLQASFASNCCGLGSVAIGGASAAQRGGRTGLLHASKRGVLPAGTRAITLTVFAVRIASAANDGYADDLSLRLSLPEPASVLDALAAGLPLALWRRRAASAKSALAAASRAIGSGAG